MPLLAIFAQRFADDLLKLRRRVPDIARERWWLLLKNRRHHFCWCVTAEWRMARYHFVEDYAETPDVGAFINRRAASLLARHVTSSSQYRAQVGLNQQECFIFRRRCRQFLLGKLCNSKIEHFYVSVSPKHDVLRLNVAVDNTGVVSSDQRTRHLDGDVNSFTQLHRSVLQAFAQRFALDQFTSNVMN